MHGDTLEVHSMAAMVLAVHCICVLMLKFSLKIYYRRLLVLSRDVLVEEVQVRLFRPSRVFSEESWESCFKRIFYLNEIEFFFNLIVYIMFLFYHWCSY